ncbi:MAG TPA: hypothetical protein VK135_03680 [Candidatus Dormibacteraeota bacterium]|nr:hypothetical protein [Candidatus Dormibacteraeota bacterium]
MKELDRLIEDNKITVFENDRLNEPLIKVDKRTMLITDYIFHYHSYKDRHIGIKSHMNGEWLYVEVNHHIQRIINNDLHDLEADIFHMRIKMTPLEILDEIMHTLEERYGNRIGELLNVLDDYITYIDFLVGEKLDDYEEDKELLYIEKDEDTERTEYHRLKISGNQLKRKNNEIIDISWFVDTVGIYTNELMLLENINTRYI